VLRIRRGVAASITASSTFCEEGEPLYTTDSHNFYIANASGTPVLIGNDSTGYIVASLPGSVATGMRTYVTNALTPVFGSTVVGGGTVTVPVFYTGAAWIVG